MEIVLDTHCHTVASGHAYSTVMEYVHEAARKKLQLLAITDHAPEMPGSTCEMHFLNMKVIPSLIEGIEVLSGVELNIMDSEGNVDLKKGYLKKLDVVIASLHLPCFPPSTLQEHTQAVVNAMKNPYIKVIGHLGDPRYPMDYKEIVSQAKQTATAIEINNSSLNPDNSRFGGEDLILEILARCKMQEVPVILGSDAHFHLDLGVVDHAMALVERAGLPPELVLNSSVALFKRFFKEGE